MRGPTWGSRLLRIAAEDWFYAYNCAYHEFNCFSLVKQAQGEYARAVLLAELIYSYMAY